MVGDGNARAGSGPGAPGRGPHVLTQRAAHPRFRHPLSTASLHHPAQDHRGSLHLHLLSISNQIQWRDRKGEGKKMQPK